jgi:hypothetical protein
LKVIIWRPCKSICIKLEFNFFFQK